MTARRITIGMKPGVSAEPAEAAFGETERNGAAAHPVHPAATIEEFLAGAHEPKPSHVAADAWVRPSEDQTNPPASLVSARISPLMGVGLGAAVGAVVAAIAMLVLGPRLTPSVDLRLAPIGDRLAAVELRQQRVEVDLGRLNNEIAQTIESGGTAASGFEAQARSVAELRQLLEKHITSAPAAAGDAGLTIFAVAVGQLRAAFHTGRPFEAELVTVYAAVEGDDSLAGVLNTLSGPSRAGVANALQLRQQLATAAAVAGLTLGGPQSYYDYGLSLVNQYVGYTSEPYTVESANVAVNDADRKLAVGDVAGAVELVRAIDPTKIAAFEFWLGSAGTFVRTDAAIAELTRTVVDRLRSRIGDGGAG